MARELAVVKVLKFDPAGGSKPTYDTYEVPYQERSVLDVLNYIYENYDLSLSFRSGCKAGFCGCCPVLLNGRPVFACQKPAEKEMTIEPHLKFEVIKDLVVNFDRPRK